MPSLSEPERLLWFLGIGLCAVLVARIWRHGLHRVYWFFFLFLCVDLAQSLAHLPFNPNSNTYAMLYMVSQPFVWLFYILIVLELYSLVLRNHQGIASLSRWTLLAALVISIGVSLLTLLPELRGLAELQPHLICYTIIERGIFSGLVVFLLLIVVFLLWFPVPLSRNVILHAIVFSVFFLSSTLALFVRNITGYELTRAVSTVLIGIASACLLAWILFLSPRGEALTMRVGRQWSRKDEAHLLEQLDAINAALLRTTRK